MYRTRKYSNTFRFICLAIFKIGYFSGAVFVNLFRLQMLKRVDESYEIYIEKINSANAASNFLHHREKTVAAIGGEVLVKAEAGENFRRVNGGEARELNPIIDNI